ncbi:C39 family peptidase [uncultured Lactobacillus sp.]|uniref:C39 family peptidase n=1 Tax=uncultured Lactobacillus sp. TaxID=153152 RepID=UPI002620C033|nr:C39 family peptidase [uncultured Lactobacillus sp.]
MKHRSAILLSTLFAAGLFAVNSNVVKADTTDTTNAAATSQTTTTEQNKAAQPAAETANNSENKDQAANQNQNQNAANQTPATNQTPQQPAKPANTRKVVADQFTGKINYIKGYGVNLWKLNDDNSLSWIAPRRLQSGSQWKVFSYTDLTEKNMRLYNLGGNQWVDGKYLVNAANNKKVVATPQANTPVNKPTASTNGMTALPKGSFVVVGYTPHYGIALYNERNNAMRYAGRHLANGTAWSTFGKKTVNNNLYYNLGGNQWVDAHWVIEGVANGKERVLKNNASSREYYTTQYNPVFAPWGCASAALSMLMKYDGTWKNVPGSSEEAKLRYMQDHLPRNKAQGGQDGNPYNGAGFTAVINSKALTNYAHALGDSKIRDISGVSLGNIAKLIEAGHPVLYYGWSSYNGNGKGVAGQQWARNHCKVIFGYNPANNTFLVHDPLYMNKHFFKGGSGQREGIYNGYDLGPIAWVSASSISREFAYKGGNNALTTI